MLVPQILLSGVIVPFNLLNNSMKSEKYVPVIGDMMVSRWAFEALAVEQFRGNNYEKYWFKIEQIKSNSSYLQSNLIPVLSFLIEDIEKEIKNGQPKTEDVKELNSGLKVLNNKIRNPYNYSVNEGNISLSKLKDVDIFLKRCKHFLSKQMNEIENRRNKIYDNLYLKFSQDNELLNFKQQYYNNSLANYVLNENEYKKLIVQNGEIIRLTEPVYYEPDNSFGRAQFYAPAKKIGAFMIDTFYFNIAVLWILSMVLYIILITGALEKFINYLILKI
jgi:hypothetical protein